MDTVWTDTQALEDDEEEENDKPKKAKPKYVVSGGLTGFGVAQDLLHIDFSPPEEAPEEFRAMAFNEKRVTTLRSGKSGTFGRMESNTAALMKILDSLEKQERMVKTMLEDRKRQLKGKSRPQPGLEQLTTSAAQASGDIQSAASKERLVKG
ncbi:g9946 [Coccomyxa viridis]|uniref:G9946 protein n=1 Tax=Coccomyxa viridis TaxID=1274662 RepID=A0ABP1GAB9_9CHLO